ncbi:roadblock/LC7 domain-containing protein [Demequina lignilytica]|uniref:Roadblock/LC7 domain-containing protein n=1 Tax=Demequina lignilytica TaxID=3051663 RepID=A0AB35MFH5_9MICO|nr:roadblock/LC7 domain-containing protein [Demequina sp. SYSU T0a273]MDN4482507.1 roadblock/LC7 domain-containing protein [Demequina sp. SYSU T0a273]
MILRDAAVEVARALHRLPEVTRVIVAGRDGLPLFDELTLADRDHGAAATATALGVAAVVADTLGLGPSQGSIVMGEDAVAVIRPLACGYSLAVVAHAATDVGDLHRRVRRHARELDEIHAAHAA